MQKEYKTKEIKAGEVVKIDTKKQYFYPQYGLTILAESQEEADKIINLQINVE